MATEAPSTLLAPFTARDGENLAVYEWPLVNWAEDRGQHAPPPRAVVLIVHGLGEHAQRYRHLARRLLQWGFAVRAYDQRGHGESTGARGALPYETALLDDLAEIIDHTRLRSAQLPRAAGQGGAPLPLIVLGHSLGGLVAGRLVSLALRQVDGLVLSSPALDVKLNPLQKLLLSVVPRLAPNLSVANGLDPRFISHDQSVVDAYLADPLVHNRISPRLGRFIAGAGRDTIGAAARWRTPTLLLYAGDDRLVRPEGSRAFVQAAVRSSAVAPGTITAQCFDSLYHEIFNEADSGQVFDTLRSWLDARFQPQTFPAPLYSV